MSASDALFQQAIEDAYYRYETTTYHASVIDLLSDPRFYLKVAEDHKEELVRRWLTQDHAGFCDCMEEHYVLKPEEEK